MFQVALSFECDGKRRSLVGLTLYSYLSAHAGDMAMHEVQPDSFAVCVAMKLLMKTENLILNFFEVKAQPVIREDQTCDSVSFLRHNRNFRQRVRPCVFDGIG